MRIAAHSTFQHFDPVQAYIGKVDGGRLAGEAAVRNPDLAERIEFNIYNDDGTPPSE